MNGENFDYGDHDDRELSDDERWARVEALTLDETLDRQQHALEQLAHGDPAGATNQWTSLHRTRKNSSPTRTRSAQPIQAGNVHVRRAPTVLDQRRTLIKPVSVTAHPICCPDATACR
jgi:hypothetical protein